MCVCVRACVRACVCLRALGTCIRACRQFIQFTGSLLRRELLRILANWAIVVGLLFVTPNAITWSRGFQFPDVIICNKW